MKEKELFDTRPNIGNLLRTKKSGPLVHIPDMKEDHVINRHSFTQDMIYYFDKYKRPLIGNTKDRDELKRDLNLLSNELNFRGLKAKRINKNRFNKKLEKKTKKQSKNIQLVFNF